MKTNPNDPAHPYEGSGLPETTGLTKREHFAAMAMQGLCVGKFHSDIMQGQCVDLAEEAVIIANSLIYALNQEVSNG